MNQSQRQIEHNRFLSKCMTGKKMTMIEANKEWNRLYGRSKVVRKVTKTVRKPRKGLRTNMKQGKGIGDLKLDGTLPLDLVHMGVQKLADSGMPIGSTLGKIAVFIIDIIKAWTGASSWDPDLSAQRNLLNEHLRQLKENNNNELHRYVSSKAIPIIVENIKKEYDRVNPLRTRAEEKILMNFWKAKKQEKGVSEGDYIFFDALRSASSDRANRTA